MRKNLAGALRFPYVERQRRRASTRFYFEVQLLVQFGQIMTCVDHTYNIVILGMYLRTTEINAYFYMVEAYQRESRRSY